MKRLELIEELETIQRNIEIVEEQIDSKMPAYYSTFSRVEKWNHLVEVRKCALKYWKRRFNRTLLKLGYNL